MQVVLSGFSVTLLCFVHAKKMYVGKFVCISWLQSYLCVDVVVMLYA